MKKTKYLIVFVTVPDKKTSDKIIKEVLNNKLAACVNVLSKVDSFYWWENKIEQSSELLLIIKTIRDNFKELEKTIKENHPYEVPEIISTEISKGSKEYLKWIDEYAG